VINHKVVLVKVTGNQGDPVDGQQDPNGQPGEGEAGENEGNKELEVELSVEELAQILGEELELPKIEPKGKKTIQSQVDRYSTIGKTGPDSLRHVKRTYKEALKRQISLGKYDPSNPTVIPNRADYRYRAADIKTELKTQPLLFI
jgi:uncharacterized sporulation protein YeaH/YhbH (DUF444 family)